MESDFVENYHDSQPREQEDILNLNNFPDNYGTNKIVEIMQQQLYSQARKEALKIDKDTKQKMTGNLSDSFPQAQRVAAMKYHNTRSYWQHLMKFTFEVWNVCIFPERYASYVTVCQDKLGYKNDFLYKDCLNSGCNLCCDNLDLQVLSIDNEFSRAVKLFQGEDAAKAKQAVSETERDRCSKACNTTYPTFKPQIEPRPPRDTGLGVTAENPALSCKDIKEWGATTNKSGTYWVEPVGKGPMEVYCDMETEGGGWTLFLNYAHKADLDLSLNANKLPEDLSQNSHMYLVNAGFQDNDIKELRFFCTEYHQNQVFYWHFSTSNKNMIKTAKTGNQQYLSIRQFSKGYVDLPPLQSMNYNKHLRLNDFNTADSVDFVGGEDSGGFTSTAFGSSTRKAFWTVVGSNPSRPKFECGTQHNYAGGTVEDESDPNKSRSHHTIWFRGREPEEDFVRMRLKKVKDIY